MIVASILGGVIFANRDIIGNSNSVITIPLTVISVKNRKTKSGIPH